MKVPLENTQLEAAVTRSSTLDAVGSWQIILPMPNVERAY